MMELAAKAAGMGGGWGDRIEYHNGAVDLRDMWILDGEDFIPWSPLTDDGDALRLAVRLDLHVQVDFGEDPAKVYVYGGWVGKGVEEEEGERDRYAATRRAITRAAAEIGRGM